MSIALLLVCALAAPSSAKGPGGYESYLSRKKELLEAMAALPLEGAVASLRELSGQGDPVAQAVFAEALSTGRGVKKDAKKAAELFEAALPGVREFADKGDNLARSVLGGLYERGRGVAQDYGRAAELYRAACDKGDARGCCNLGMMYYEGWGVAKDLAKAADLERKACDGGFGEGCRSLGVLHSEGQGAELDTAKAVELYRKACGMKDADACWFLADMVAEGQGVERNPGKVLELYAESCALGSGAACHNLGSKYHGGEGVAKDDARAGEYFRRACDLGEPAGCEGLGIVRAAKAVDGLLQDYAAKLKTAGGAKENGGMTKTADGPLLRLTKAAEIGTDARFRKLLAEGKKAPGHRAPERLRALLASFEILRMSMGEAYAHEDGASSRSWWFGEIGVAGEASATAEKLRSALKAAGFTPGPERDGKTAYARASGGVSQEVVVEGPHRWVGGRRTACGFRLRWTVTDGKQAPAPPLAALLAELPLLRDARLEDSLYEALASTPTESLAVGGTWTRYYDWDASFSAEGPEGAARLHESLRALLAALGFEASGAGEDGSVPYQRPKTGSFAWLSPPDAKGRVRLRIQPES